MIRDRFSTRPFAGGVPAALIPVLATTYGTGVVALFASGRLDLRQAGLLLGGPVVLALAVLRPEWMILVIVASPPAVSSRIPTVLLIEIMVATLFGFLLQDGLHLGPKTGIYPLVGIIGLAVTMKADVTAGTGVAGERLQSVIYFALLMLAAFHAAANGRIRIDTFLNAILLAIVVAAILQPLVGSIPSYGPNPFRGKFAYLATMGFGITYVRFSLSDSPGRKRSALDALLASAFLFLAAIGFGRAAWIAGFWIFALVSIWTRRRWFWVASSLLVVIVLMVPVVREQILHTRTADVTSQAQLEQITTGRTELWGKLWARGVETWPMGQGWGYVESLTSVDLFGREGVFTTDKDPFIYAHNDFLYLFVQLGIVGAGLLLAYWLSLLRKIRLLSHSRVESARYSVRVLVPMIIVMFVVQMFDNGFAIPIVADKFFAASGLIFGLHYAVREGERSAAGGSRFVGPSLQSQRKTFQPFDRM